MKRTAKLGKAKLNAAKEAAKADNDEENEIDPARISIETLVAGRPDSPRYLRAVIGIVWGESRGQLDVAGTRQLALRLLDAAACAENDELVLKFLMEKIGVQLNQAVAALQDLRKMRMDWTR